MVQPLEENQAGAVPFAEKRRDEYVRIQSRDFVRFITRHFDINLEKSFRIPAYWDEVYEILVIGLQKAEVGNDDDTD
jgi:hypothetical protein